MVASATPDARRIRRRHDVDRLADEVGQFAAEHAARRAVHPLDAVLAETVTMPTSTEVQDGPRALGSLAPRAARCRSSTSTKEQMTPGQGLAPPARTATAPDAGPSRRRSRRSPLKRPLVRNAAATLASNSTGACAFRARRRPACSARGCRIAGERGHRLVGALDARAALVDDAHLREAEHQSRGRAASVSSSVCALQARVMSVSTATARLVATGSARHRERIPDRSGPRVAGPAARHSLSGGPAGGLRLAAMRVFSAPSAAMRSSSVSAGSAAGRRSPAYARSGGCSAPARAGRRCRRRGAVEDGRQLAQQLLVGRWRVFLLGRPASPRRWATPAEGARLHAREQPAHAQLGGA